MQEATEFVKSTIENKVSKDHPELIPQIISCVAFPEIGVLKMEFKDGTAGIYSYITRTSNFKQFAYKEICDEVIYILIIQNRLKLFMLQSNNTTESLSNISGVPVSIIDYYLHDQCPTFQIPTVKRLCDKMNVSMGQLLDR